MFRRPRSFRTLLWITSMTILLGWRVSDAEAQQIRPYLVVAVDVDGRMNYVQFSACYVPCQRAMQMDDPAAGQTMIILLKSSMTTGLAGTFVMVDHTKKTIQVLEFTEPALADFILSANAPHGYQTISIEEEPNPLYPGCLLPATAAEWLKQALDPAATPTSEGEGGGLSKTFCTPTIKVPKLVHRVGSSLRRTGAAPKTVTLYDFVLGRTIEVEAEQYAFEFNYEMDMLPWLSQMAGDKQAAALSGASPQGSQVPDLKLVMRSEGTSWVAPKAPGAADVFGFYRYMVLAMLQQTHLLHAQTSARTGMTGAPADMTAKMIVAMAAIAENGMPIETTTKVTIAPSTGPNAPAALDLSAFLPKNAFPSSSSTSKVVGIGRTIVDFDQGVPDWMALSYAPELWDEPGTNEQGYEVFHSPPLGEGTATGQ